LKPATSKEGLHYLDIESHIIPVKIIQEFRWNTRISLGKKYVILRTPKVLLPLQLNKPLQFTREWLYQLYSQNPSFVFRYSAARRYNTNSILDIGGEKFVIHVVSGNNKNASLHFRSGNTIQIILPDHEEIDTQKLIKKLLIRFAQKYFHPKMSERVHYFNSLYFNKEINTISLKYNLSNWGSCSTGKNLNFSIRLLFAPQPVIDYVIIHELAHLVEMNHSDRFWKIVSDIMPDYKIHEKDLKENRYLYDF
jgi:predicted metal-dependent hydrolase